MYLRDASKKEPDWNWREVDFTVQLMFPMRGVRDLAAAKIRLQSLSEGGALILTGGLRSVPDFFYLQFNSDSHETIGCWVAKRIANAIHCRFLRELTTSELDRIITEQEMISILDKLEQDREEQMVQEILRIL